LLPALATIRSAKKATGLKKEGRKSPQDTHRLIGSREKKERGQLKYGGEMCNVKKNVTAKKKSPREKEPGKDYPRVPKNGKEVSTP